MVFPADRDTLITVPVAAFHDPALGHIAAAVNRRHLAGEIIDVAVLAGDLRHEGILDLVGEDRLISLWNDTASVAGAAPIHAAAIITAWRSRQVLYHTAEVDRAVREGRDYTEHLAAIEALDNGTTTSSSCAQVDLGPVLAGDTLTQPPEILARDDGQLLIYRGKVHAFNAESETGKSWLALYACKEQIHAGQHVTYLDFEDGAEGVTERLLALGTIPAHLYGDDRLFHYIRPDDPIDQAAVNALAQLGVALVVIDGVTEAMTLNGMSIKENDDVARFLSALPRVFARAGSAVILIDHVVKNKAERGVDAIGGVHKRNGIDGASYMLEPLRPFGRGMSGAARITVTKDRPGHIRPICAAGKTVGELRLTSTGDTATLTVVAPDALAHPDAGFRPTVLMERISKFVEEAGVIGERPNVNTIMAAVKGAKDAKSAGLAALIVEGFVATEPGPRKSNLHASTTPYREATDPRSDKYTPAPTDSDDPSTWEDF